MFKFVVTVFDPNTASVLCYMIIHPYTSSFLSYCFPSVLSSQHDQIRNRIPLFLSHSANQPSRTDSTLAMLSAPEPVIDHPRISQHTLTSPAVDSRSTPHGLHPIQVSVQSWPIHQHSVLYHGRYRTLGLDPSPNRRYHVPTLYIR